MSYLRRYAPALTVVLSLLCLYLYDLAGVGVLDPDEPRYLAIGRAMASSGDYLTPRLWGTPWFEKPPLLYWLVALGTHCGLGLEVAGRLPVALLSLLFAAAMFFFLRREFGVLAAATASIALVASAEWLAYSSVALTDIPLAACFSTAIFVVLPLVRSNPPAPVTHRRTRLLAAGLLLGCAALAKGLVPVALAIPLLFFLRREWRAWWLGLAGFLLIALPWYLAVTLLYGRAFLADFFWKHHFERIYSATLLHPEPWWYYLPVLLAALFPWTPLFAAFFVRRYRKAWDERHGLLASTVIFGVLVFSASLNKLPGYLLPLLPAAFALLGAGIDWHQIAHSARRWLIAPAILIALFPLAARLLPEMLRAGRLTLPHGFFVDITTMFYIAVPLAVLLAARKAWVGMLLVLCFAASGLFLKITAYPVLDRTVSARALWRQLRNNPAVICTDWLGRDWVYGLALYRGTPYPVCDDGRSFDFALQSPPHSWPVLVPRKK